MLITRLLPTAALVATALTASAIPASVQAAGHSSAPVTVYFTRHARKETVLVDTLNPASTTYEADYTDEGLDLSSPGMTEDVADGMTVGTTLEEVCSDDKCAEVLSDRGEQYAELLADFFARRGIRFDAVYSSHKERTRQTVAPTATAQGIIESPVEDGQDDGVIQLPAFSSELEPQGTSDSECLTLAAIRLAAPGSTLLVAGHSGTLYDIMGDGNGDKCEGLGLLGDDDSSSDQFPKDSKGKVENFNDVWKVTIRTTRKDEERARLNYRINLQPTALRVIERAGRDAQTMAD